MSFRRASLTQVRLRNGKLVLSTAAAGGGEAPGGETGNPGTALALSTVFTDLRVYQRVGMAKTLSIGGTCAGNPSAIQARVVDATTLAEVTAWATVATNPAGDVWTGQISVPQGSWYKIQVRDGGNFALSAQSSNKFGVGIVMALIGQSNMVNFNETSFGFAGYPLSHPSVVEFEPLNSPTFRKLGRLTSGTYYAPGTVASVYGANYTNSGGFQGDGYVFLMNIMADELGVPVAAFERAAGGQAISTWMSGQPNWTTFTNTLTAAGGDCEIAIWYQGESNSGTSKASMLSSLATLHGQLHTATGRDSSNFHFGIVSLGPASAASSYSGSSDTKIGVTRSAHVEYANNTAGAFYVTGMQDVATSDGIHVNAEGYNRAGRRWPKSVVARLKGQMKCGPRITSATRSGTTVTVNLQHTGGTSLMDGAGGTGTALTGFQFFDAGAGGVAISYTATSITGATTVQITLASEPVGALTMSYAMQNAPHNSPANEAGNFVPASALYDNDLTFNSTKGMLLQPLEAITVG